MTNKWLYGFYVTELERVSEDLIERTKLLKELKDEDMCHALHQARQYDINLMFTLCRLIRNLK